MHVNFCRRSKTASKPPVRVRADIKRYILTASKDQILWVSTEAMNVVITLEKGKADVVKTDDGIQAELKEDGDYVIEVANTGDSPAEVTLTFEIQYRGE